MNISGFIQFVIGFVIGIILFGTGIAGGAYYFLTKIDSDPANPVFSENTTMEDPPVVEENPAPSPPEPVVKVEPEPEPEPEKDELPEGAYRARVTWSTGLSLRSAPSTESERIGGVGYNAELIILNVSPDNRWQRVRVAGSNQEGWVKAGNVNPIN